MITRTYLHPVNAVRYSWKNICFSAFCAAIAYILYISPHLPHIEVPISVVAILGTALAIILGFRNASAYDRWWEARKIWGGIVNESRTFTRQALTLADPRDIPEYREHQLQALVRNQLAWINALRMQLRGINDPEAWKRDVAPHMQPELYAMIMNKTNKATHIAIHQGRLVKILNTEGVMDDYSYVQIDDTLTRLTDLQGMSERIKATPLPRPYDYYTLAFLNLFILFFPFGVMNGFIELGMAWMIFPVTIVVGWIFFQIYIFGKVMSNPFENWKTDVPLDAICTTIAIDLKEILGDTDIPAKLQPSNGTLM
jgi:ion channel-forming bestrophin family protein